MTSGELCTKKTLEVEETQKKVTDAVMTSIDSTFAGHFHSAILKLPMELTDSETARLQDGTMSKLHMDVDAGTETMESVVDVDGRIAGRRMRYMVRNREIAESTCGVYGGLALELGSQEIALMLDGTWGKEYSQEEEV
jgi:hypothetical protein